MRIVVVSDTHALHGSLDLPDGDVLVHCGDICSGQIWFQAAQLTSFNDWLGSLPFKHKIVIAGNHDHLLGKPAHAAAARAMLTNCTYLQDSEIALGGVRFYGSPWTPDFFPDHWVFNQPRTGRRARDRWAQIPDNTEVLITHGPPRGILDECPDIRNDAALIHVGCEDLRRRIRQLKKLRFHFFGHIHEGSGQFNEAGVRFVNAASLDGKYSVRDPGYTIIDL